MHFLNQTLGAGQACDARHSGPRGEDCETSAVLRQKTGRHDFGTPLVLFLKDNGFQGTIHSGNLRTTVPVCCHVSLCLNSCIVARIKLQKESAVCTVLTFQTYVFWLKVHKIENFFGSDFEFCTISLLVMFKY